MDFGYKNFKKKKKTKKPNPRSFVLSDDDATVERRRRRSTTTEERGSIHSSDIGRIVSSGEERRHGRAFIVSFHLD
jgi:hypothetical protein